MLTRAFYAVLLAAGVGFAYRRAWRWEHGAENDTPLGGDRGKETLVWLPATILPAGMLTALLVLAIVEGPRRGLRDFAGYALAILLLLTVYAALLATALPLLRRRFSARSCATLWVLPVFLFYAPWFLLNSGPVPRWTVYIPEGALRVFFLVWAAGFILVYGAFWLRHLRFRRRVLRAAAPVRDARVLALWTAELTRADYRKETALLCSPDAAAPFSVGRSKRTRATVLPARDYTDAELTLIFRHEIRHLQRCDVDTKVFLAFLRALGWFDPLLWLAAGKAAEDLELSCDESVADSLDGAGRREYAELLLRTAGEAGGFTTCLSASAESLRYRLRAVLAGAKKLRGTLLLMAVMFAVTMLFGVVAVADRKGSYDALLLTEGREIGGVYGSWLDTQFQVVEDYDETALRESLAAVQLRRLTALGAFENDGGRWLEIVLTAPEGYRYVTLRDRTVTVQGFRDAESECYVVVGEVDWEAIAAALG